MIPHVLVAPVTELAQTLTTTVAAVCARAIGARGAAHVAVTGGSLLTRFGSALAEADVDWTRVHVYFGDERAVPPSHADSNFRLARETWLDHVNVAPAHVHRMPAELDDLDLAARQYEETLRRCLGPTPRFDVVLLGVGPDGHVCSLFPGHAALDVRDRLVTAVFDSPKPPPRRLTLTMTAIGAARSAVIVAVGTDKAGAVRDGYTNARPDLPIARVVQAAASVTFLLDPEAASLIET